MRLVGLVSSYKEGRLLEGAIRSLQACEPDLVLVYEGPAGDPLEADVPPSMLPKSGWTAIRNGRWRTDARKRQAMMEDVKRRFPRENVWGLWLDGDEILLNGEYLRDLLQAVEWNDEQDPSGAETIRYPLRVVEADGSIAVTTSHLVRLDLIRSYDISASVVTNSRGVEEGWGNKVEDARLWLELWMHATETGRMLAWPPHPCEPHIFHRSHLRHPLRRGLRLHKQEADELRKAGKL